MMLKQRGSFKYEENNLRDTQLLFNKMKALTQGRHVNQV